MTSPALERSIVHWKEIRDGEELLWNADSTHCALCTEYASCSHCPLFGVDECCQNEASVYRLFCKGLIMAGLLSCRISTMSTITPAQREILYPLADNMVKKLESLR